MLTPPLAYNQANMGTAALAPEKQMSRLEITSAELSSTTESLYFLFQRTKNLRDRLLGIVPEANSDKSQAHIEPPGHLNRIDAQINGIRLIIQSTSKILEEIENCA